MKVESGNYYGVFTKQGKKYYALIPFPPYIDKQHTVTVGDAYIDTIGYLESSESLITGNVIKITCANQELDKEEYIGMTVVVPVNVT